MSTTPKHLDHPNEQTLRDERTARTLPETWAALQAFTPGHGRRTA